MTDIEKYSKLVDSADFGREEKSLINEYINKYTIDNKHLETFVQDLKDCKAYSSRVNVIVSVISTILVTFILLVLIGMGYSENFAVGVSGLLSITTIIVGGSIEYSRYSKDLAEIVEKYGTLNKI